MLLRVLLSLNLTLGLVENCAADPIATLLASPCRDNLDVEQALRRELSRHNWIDRGWNSHKKGTAYEVSYVAALNKMSEISFNWQLENDAVIPTNPFSLALCRAH